MCVGVIGSKSCLEDGGLQREGKRGRFPVEVVVYFCISGICGYFRGLVRLNITNSRLIGLGYES